MPQTFTVLVDDNLLEYESGGSQSWKTGKGSGEQYVNSSTHDAQSSSLSFNYTFYGKAITWTGVRWGGEDTKFNVWLDDKPQSSCGPDTGDDEDEEVDNVYGQLCPASAVTAANGVHTVKAQCRGVDEEEPVSIDYITYQVETDGDVPGGLSAGMYLVADDTDSGVSYEGTWEVSSPKYTNGNVRFTPFGGGVHRSNIAGSKLSYTFSGTDITVYGVQLGQTGSLQATLNIDGTKKGEVSIQSSKQDVSNKVLVSAAGLSEGKHTVELVLDVITGEQALVVDYFLYAPLYGQSTSVDGVSGGNGGNSGSGSTSGTGGGDGNGGNGGGDGGGGGGGGGGSSKAWIAGLAVGLVALALLGGLTWWWWKRKHRARGAFLIDNERAPPGGQTAVGGYRSVPTADSTGFSPAAMVQSRSAPPRAVTLSPPQTAERTLTVDTPPPEGAHHYTQTSTPMMAEAALFSGAAAHQARNLTLDTSSNGTGGNATIFDSPLGTNTTPASSFLPAPPPPVPAKESRSDAGPPSSWTLNAVTLASQTDRMNELDAKRRSRTSADESQDAKLQHFAQERRRSIDEERRKASVDDSKGEQSVVLSPTTDGGTPTMDADALAELVRRNEELRREVERLSEMPPPAYEGTRLS
ncbi:hypothetical protein CYLTODRAFT_486542 [Cylindrobasidium torrendii FP15055 ss-10]|uniref:Uncharacterized protein n=1 Tax=Cylindrobasidium torrendii FP15055 ss-10 TaxID=1314674 RepID=A0A0D7BR91_9AGAR|nr:hypothetical protein CYLTODRAFT_486542 [Cylindrobasidium torrendii FP15055 ss-10]